MRVAQTKTRVRSVARASRLLVWIARRAEGATASEAAAAMELTLPTAYHLLNTLVDEGLLAKDSRRRYGPGPKFAVFSEAHLRANRVPEYLFVPLRDLAERTGDTAYIAAWRGENICNLASVDGRNAVRVAELSTGVLRPANARAAGKTLLAFADEDRRASYLALDPPVRVTERSICDPDALAEEFERIRARGYAIDEGEFLESVACVSVPLLDAGVVVAVYTVTSPLHDFARRRDQLVDAVRAATEQARALAGTVDG